MDDLIVELTWYIAIIFAFGIAVGWWVYGQSAKKR